MHELAVALEILALVRRHVQPDDAARVRDVRVRIGELAGVVPDSLEFCFSAAVAGTPWQHAVLLIERVPARARCEDCQYLFATGMPGAGCPACGSARVRMATGQELQVASVDLAETDPGGDVSPASPEAVA